MIHLITKHCKLCEIEMKVNASNPHYDAMCSDCSDTIGYDGSERTCRHCGALFSENFNQSALFCEECINAYGYSAKDDLLLWNDAGRD